ncbi:MAG: hypothetical protein K9H64_20160 [Bacteroidales bacterium]|nr:hypothetical protein [Bacteroidales bacterium]MCF8458371.1 hypothetical protein [Bacteroidales bacterium]
MNIHFGKIIKEERPGKMRQKAFLQASQLGKIADEYWYKIPTKFPYVQLDAFTVMPNHVHGIIVIDKKQSLNKKIRSTTEKERVPDKISDKDSNNIEKQKIIEEQEFVETRFIASPNPTEIATLHTSKTASPNPTEIGSPDPTKIAATKMEPQKSGGITGNKNPMLYENLSRVLRWYKGRCSFEMHTINPEFYWQYRFHDHIIRNKEEYHKIKNYILSNPENWEKDKFYRKN